MIVARTIKGKGVSFMEGLNGWHGRPLKKDEADRAIAQPAGAVQHRPGRTARAAHSSAAEDERRGRPQPPRRAHAARVQTGRPSSPRARRTATALVKLGEVEPRVVVLDADVKNSTFSDKFEKVFAGRFYEDYIAEQAMLGVGDGACQPRCASPFRPPSPAS